LEEEIVDFKNDPIAFADFMKKYVLAPERDEDMKR